jgi:hypothetical protein
LGEWFLDKRLGVPYFKHILIKNPDLGLVRSLYRRILQGVPTVASIERLVLTLDKGKRELTVDWKVTLFSGITVEAITPLFIGE